MDSDVARERTIDVQQIEQWGIFEAAWNGPSEGNPFTEVELTAEFRQDERVVKVDGFYDGDGVYRVRFQPDSLGTWEFTTSSNHPALDGQTGSLACIEPSVGNHGPVQCDQTWYLAYADGTPYFQVGTTCYAWAHQGDELEEQTLATLAVSPFNKLRMCVFPKHYKYSVNEPPYYAFEGQPLTDWDFTRFDPRFWQHFEQRVAQLCELGIEADLILFHPYDHWGFREMPAEVDDFYLRYCVARLAAYRNVWWSFANEFDLMEAKTEADWDRMLQLVQQHDPYDRLRGIHNCRGFYDHTKPWVSHCSIQSSDFEHMADWRETYRKPVLYDECRYEGNIPENWGNIDAAEMTRRFWLGATGGCYVGHGETYQHPEDVLWWSKGGVLHGESPARIAFFRDVMGAGPTFAELQPLGQPAEKVHLLAQPGEYYLLYFDADATVELELPGSFQWDELDTWTMVATPRGTVSGTVELSSERGRVLRLRRS